MRIHCCPGIKGRGKMRQVLICAVFSEKRGEERCGVLTVTKILIMINIMEFVPNVAALTKEKRRKSVMRIFMIGLETILITERHANMTSRIPFLLIRMSVGKLSGDAQSSGSIPVYEQEKTKRRGSGFLAVSIAVLILGLAF